MSKWGETYKDRIDEHAFVVKSLTDKEIKEMYFDNKYYIEGEFCVLCFVRNLELEMTRKAKQ